MADKSEVVTSESGAHYQPPTTGEQAITQEARERLSLGHDGQRDRIEKYTEDVAFLDGEDQWSEEAKNARGTKRPMLTINKLPAFVDSTAGENRQNKIAIHVAATSQVGDEKMTTKAGKEMSRADAYEALIRDIEQQSSAQDAYDTALETVLAGGLGNWIVRTEYVADDVFTQNIVIDRILDPTLVVLDPHAKKADRSDGNWGFLLDWMERSEFDARYPGKFPPGDLDTDVMRPWGSWFRTKDDHVAVAEYYRRVPMKRTIAQLSDGTVIDTTAQADIMDELEERGEKVVRTRDVRSHKVEFYRVGGTRILEGPTEFPARWIPIIAVTGKELAVDGEVRTRGIVRHAKDAQRAYNYWRTATTEFVALTPKMPFVAAAEQVEDNLTEWQNANAKNQAVLTYSHIPDIPPPQRQVPPQIPAGMVNETLAADADIRATVGQFNPSIGESEEAQSGRAIQALQQKTSVNTFTYIDNLSRGIRHTGRILVDMIPRVYDSQRVVRLLHEDESEDFLQLFEPITDQETGKESFINDLRAGRYGINIRVGPSFATQRLAAVQAILLYLERDPDAAPLVRDLVAGNLDHPAAKMMAERLRKTVPPELLEGERGDEGEQRPPSQEQKIAAVEAEARLAEMEAKVEAAEAKSQQEQVKLMQLMKDSGLDREALVQLIQSEVAQLIRQNEGSPAPTPADGLPADTPPAPPQ